MTDATIAAAARNYVLTRDVHQNAGPLLSTLKAAHQSLIDAVHAATTPGIDLPDQARPACSTEHPGQGCPQPTLLEV